MRYDSFLDPTLSTQQPTATTQPAPKPTTPTDTSGALPLAGAPTTGSTQPAGSPVPALPDSSIPAPTSPPPLTTSDPLAFATPPSSSGPVATSPYTATNGQTYVGGTQTTDPTTGQVTQNGVLGQQYVPGSNGGLVDLGGGMAAPAPGTDPTQGYFFGAPHEILTANGANPTSDMSLQAGLYGTSGYNPGNLFQAVYRGPAGDLIFAAPGFNPDQLPTGATLLSGNAPFQGAPSAANGTTSQQLAQANATSPATRNLSPGSANDVTPSTPTGGLTLPPTAQGGASAPPAGGTPGASSGLAGSGVNLTPTTVDNALTNFTISPNNTVDRVKLAQDAIQNTIQNVLDPAYHARERDLNRYNFGAGRGVSGDARTSQGTLASDYGNQVANLSNTLLNAATNGSIEDLYRNIGIAQQQQGFQAGQQNTAFNQALQQLIAGNQGNPADIALVLAQIFGSGAGLAGNAANNYVASQQNQQNQQQQNQIWQSIIDAMTRNGMATSGPNIPYGATSSGDYGY